MNFNTKVRIISVIVLIFFPVFAFWQYQKIKPEPVIIVPREEINVTIIPGWTLDNIADSWLSLGLVDNKEQLFKILGAPQFIGKYDEGEKIDLAGEDAGDVFNILKTRPKDTTYEGYLIPDTYRVYKDSEIEDVLYKIFYNLDEKITVEMLSEIKKQGKTFYEVLTMASVVEREAREYEDMKMVADIFWRRNEVNWALQSCATVNYVTGKNSPAVSAQDKQVDSLYNTYKYPGLPPGPIANPSLNAIMATIYPKSNSYWYFMSGRDGAMHYAVDLDGHNTNVYKYLR